VTESFKLTRFIYKKEHLTPAEHMGKETIPTSTFLLSGILTAASEDPGFLPDLVLIHCFLEDEYTLEEAKTEPLGKSLLHSF